MQDLAALGIPVWELVLRCAVIYLVMVFGLRLFGKREVGQFTLFDIVLVLLIANAVQPAMTGPDSSLVGGLIIIATLLALNFAVGRLREHSPVVRALVQSHPTIIARDGRWLPEALRREGIDEDESAAALREHGLDSVEACKLAVLETDGTISVVPMDSQVLKGRRRLRYRQRNL
jgi:uncharacterized membrane protein YcaP (DUF421 family)